MLPLMYLLSASNTVTESTTISRCIAGDQAAYKRLYESYMPYFLTIVRRYGISSSEERDLLQDIFIEVFSSLERYKPALGSFKTWSRALAVYKILNHKRKRGLLKVSYIDEVQEDQATVEVDLRDLDSAYIMKAIRDLPDRYQTVFNLYSIDGYNHKEIAKLLSISEVASRSHLHRARLSLKKSLTRLRDII